MEVGFFFNLNECKKYHAVFEYQDVRHAVAYLFFGTYILTNKFNLKDIL